MKTENLYIKKEKKIGIETEKIWAIKFGDGIKVKSMRIHWSVIEEIHTIGKKNKLIKKNFSFVAILVLKLQEKHIWNLKKSCDFLWT